MRDTPETLGDMAEILQEWQEDGITRGAILYVVDMIWYKEDD